jgi:ribosomal protein S27E
MVLVGRNTRCSICGEAIKAPGIATLKHFMRNERDRLAIFSGRAFHRSCFEVHPLGEVAELICAQRADWAATPCPCVVCGDILVSGGVTTDLMVSESEHPLSSFNYLCFHREHLADWKGMQEFKELVREAELNGTWKGEPIVPRR